VKTSRFIGAVIVAVAVIKSKSTKIIVCVREILETKQKAETIQTGMERKQRGNPS
jgi:hypothetical protein